jgi:hypothetical protein
MSNHFKYTSIYKGIPVEVINEHKKFIDFTRYYIKYRGPRKGAGYSTLKSDAHSGDIYEYPMSKIIDNRIDRGNYLGTF